jgi:hypothetical protein
MTNFYGQYIGFGAGGVVDLTPLQRGSRGFACAGHSKTTIDYFTIATLGSSADFGDTDSATNGKSGVTNITRGLMPAGSSAAGIEYITCASLGNGQTFGDQTHTSGGKPITVGNGTRGIMCGADDSASAVIDVVTIASTGNASTNSDLTVARGGGGRGEDNTRAVMMGGQGSSGTNTIDYITMATDDNAIDFSATLSNSFGYLGGTGGGGRAMAVGGCLSQTAMEFVVIQTTGTASAFGDLFGGHRGIDACSNDTRGVACGGYNQSTDMQYWAMLTEGNAADFGDMVDGKQYNGCMSGVPL